MIPKSNLSKPLEELTALEREQVLKHKKAETEEILKTLGQESDTKAAPWVRKYSDQKELEDKKQRDMALEVLTGLRGNRKAYMRFLVNVLIAFTRQEDVGKNRQIEVDLTDRGVVIKIRKTKYTGAFSPSGIPFYDYHACKLMAVKLGNTCAKLDGYHRSSDGGVLLPYEDEQEAYGGRNSS